ncbi:uncharacterized protein VTP21DRAFT_3742 [Calcarisporiella thermophila]|uniref:uncharacterized protein n=1 Tax=Calcarisporiella thermophila TaxID=911321 RepID=UPI0037435966
MDSIWPRTRRVVREKHRIQLNNILSKLNCFRVESTKSASKTNILGLQRMIMLDNTRGNAVCRYSNCVGLIVNMQ